MKVSIVIPVYNAERYLDECIRSALGQTYPNTEIIAVDDGSTDSSPDILKGYADRVRVFRKPNGGTASALNYGHRQMRGDWFKWLSADDTLEPHAVETLRRAAADIGAASRRCILYADYDSVDELGRPAPEWRSRERDYNGLGSFERNVILLDHFYGNGIASMFHRGILDRCGPFDEGLGLNEDCEFWLGRCLLHGCDMRFVPGVVARWRVHGSQTTSVRGAELRGKDDSIRSLVLSRLPADRREAHAEALREYQRPCPACRGPKGQGRGARHLARSGRRGPSRPGGGCRAGAGGRRRGAQRGPRILGAAPGPRCGRGGGDRAR